MKVSAQELWLNSSRSDRLGFLATALGVLTVAAAICNGAVSTQETTEPIWPTKEWQTSSPEEQGMDSEKLAELVDFGTRHGFDSVLVARHGKIVAEAYYAPYVASIPHTVNSCTKSVIGTLVAIASRMAYLIVRTTGPSIFLTGSVSSTSTIEKKPSPFRICWT